MADIANVSFRLQQKQESFSSSSLPEASDGKVSNVAQQVFASKGADGVQAMHLEQEETSKRWFIDCLIYKTLPKHITQGRSVKEPLDLILKHSSSLSPDDQTEVARKLYKAADKMDPAAAHLQCFYFQAAASLFIKDDLELEANILLRLGKLVAKQDTPESILKALALFRRALRLPLFTTDLTATILQNIYDLFRRYSPKAGIKYFNEIASGFCCFDFRLFLAIEYFIASLLIKSSPEDLNPAISKLEEIQTLLQQQLKSRLVSNLRFCVSEKLKYARSLQRKQILDSFNLE